MADFKLDPTDTALVLIEFQNEFTSPGGKLYDAVKDCLEQKKTLENAKKLMETMRRAGCKIIHVPVSFEPGHPEISNTPYGILAGIKEGGTFVNGEWGADFHPDFKPQKGDMVVKGKSALCGFHSTNLDFLLRQNGIKNMVLGGFLTNCCVESTMRQGYENGYKVYTLKDCVAATSVAASDSTIEYNFGMFSIPTTSDVVASAIKAPVSA